MLVFTFLPDCAICGRSVSNEHQGIGVDIYITFWVLVKVCNVLSLVTSNTLSADILANLNSTDDLSCAAVFVLYEGLHICIYLREHKRSIILKQEFSFLYGFHWDWPTAEHP